MDGDDTGITAGSIVTVFVNLKRQMMDMMFDNEMLSKGDADQDNMIVANQDNDFNKYQVRRRRGGTLIKCKDNMALQIRKSNVTNMR